MTRKIVKNWGIGYTNNSGYFHHKDDKPSVIEFYGYISFCKKDKYHRKGKPSVIYPDGTLEYWENDELVKEIEI